MAWRLLLLLPCILLTACSSYYRSNAALEIAPKVMLNLDTMAPSMKGQTWQQVMYVTNQQQQHTLLSQLAVDNAGTLKLLIMTSQGLPIIELEKAAYQAMKSTKMLPGVALDATFVLADIALVHWPVEYLTQQLTGAKVVQTGSQRLITHAGSTLYRIRYQGDTTTLENNIRDYKITFKKVTQ